MQHDAAEPAYSPCSPSSGLPALRWPRHHLGAPSGLGCGARRPGVRRWAPLRQDRLVTSGVCHHRRRAHEL